MHLVHNVFPRGKVTGRGYVDELVTVGMVERVGFYIWRGKMARGQGSNLPRFLSGRDRAGAWQEPRSR
jgi:hypothetical protein